MSNIVKIRNLSLTLLVAGGLLSGCSSTKPSGSSGETSVGTRASASTSASATTRFKVGEVGGETVTYDELIANYQPSESEKPVTADDLVSFLPSYLDYKAKLAEARDAGYFELESINQEYEQFAKQAAYSYWMNNKLEQELIDTLYQRSDEELKVQHILISVPPEATPKDTTEAWNKLMEARKMYLDKQVEFGKLIGEYSTVSRGRPMGGEVGYFTAGQTVKPFEDAAYALAKDSVSYPVRTQFGYHLIRMKDRRERQSDRRVSHIYFKSGGQGGRADSALWARAESAWQQLEKGAKWDSLAQAVSDDRNSASRGGRLGWFNYGRYPEAIIDTIMALDQPGDYTRPFESQYGVQIIKLDSIRTFPSVKAEKADLMKQLKKLPRYKNNKELVRGRLREIGNARWQKDALSELNGYIQSRDTIKIKNIDAPSRILKQELYSFNGKQYRYADYMEWLKKERGENAGNRYRKEWVNDFETSILENNLVPLTKREFPEFGDKVSNYKNGLVVFQISEDSVWSKATIDTTVLHELYEQNPGDYRFPERYVFSEIISYKDSTARKAEKMLAKNMHPDSLENHIGRLEVRRDTTGFVESLPYSKLKGLQPGTYSDTFKHKRRQYIMYLHTKLEPRRMTFKEAFDRLFSQYQPQREEAWLQRLRKRHNVEAYPERLRKAYQQKPVDSFGAGTSTSNPALTQ